MIKQCITVAALIVCPKENQEPPGPSVIPEMAASYAHIEEDSREIEESLRAIEVLFYKRGLISEPVRFADAIQEKE